MTCSPLEGFLVKSGPNLLLRMVVVKETLPSSVELLHMEESLAERNADRTEPRLLFAALK